MPEAAVHGLRKPSRCADTGEGAGPLRDGRKRPPLPGIGRARSASPHPSTDHGTNPAGVPMNSTEQPAQTVGPDLVDGFADEFRFLSNYYDSPLTWDSIDYATAEAAFAAGKTLDPAQRTFIAAAASPGEAKRRGRQAPLRELWDKLHRYEVMDQVLAAKFADPGLRDRLICTGTALLVEANTWHDQFCARSVSDHVRSRTWSGSAGIRQKRATNFDSCCSVAGDQWSWDAAERRTSVRSRSASKRSSARWRGGG